MMKWKNLFKTFGPGILFASTAIGVSHLVQSTRAGAEYGFSLLIFVLLANILKYPFFEFGSRYANVTGKSLLHGYKKRGSWLVIAYLIFTFLSMFVVIAAVGYVCAGLMGQLLALDFNIHIIVLILFLVCVFILLFGGFSILDSLIKFVSIILLISTLSAFIIVIINGSQPHVANFTPPNIFDRKSLLFIIALIGWMPTAVDMSVWNSIWTVERINHSGYKPKLNETLLEFNIGYVATIILSVCFITLGAFVMYGSGELFPNSSSEFAKKLIYLYTHSLGKWSYWIIAIASFSVMFSTTLAVFDGYARTIRDSFSLLFEIKLINKIYSFVLLLLGFVGYLIVWKFIDSFKQLIDLATTISFLIAPFCAILNYRIIFSSDIPNEKKPPYWIKLLSLLGIVFLLVFSLIFIMFL